MSQRVLGLDGYPRGWVVASIAGGQLESVTTVTSLHGILPAEGIACIAVDMPLSFPRDGSVRPAETEARARLGRRASSVFLTPPRAVLESPTHTGAISIAREMGVPAPSAQSYSLRGKILEAAPIAASDSRFIEVHPELSFLALNSAPLHSGKRTWNGLHERLAILRHEGIELPAVIDAQAPPDDVLDAAVAALTAWRYCQDQAASLPCQSPPESPRHRIWLPAA